jgi:hypothetical protein
MSSKISADFKEPHEDTDLLTETQTRRLYGKVIEALVDSLVELGAKPEVIAAVRIRGAGVIVRMRWAGVDPLLVAKMTQALGMAQGLETVLEIKSH